MKTWKLVSGILSIILFVIMTFQSCVAGIVEAVVDEETSAGSVGFVCGLLILAGGIISIASRKSKKNGGNIALIIVFSLSAILGFTLHGIYIDLIIWSVWAAANAIVALIALFSKKDETEDSVKQKKNGTVENKIEINIIDSKDVEVKENENTTESN